ncbi:hypothetical protein DDQ68_02315 [Hymenobacter nivis]|uniref:Uncharacterized protein n=1 Tax=Hymenobacter nivis TaxID=1850093 RepID=A0A2Z3GIL0_9BACT|nr:hypothetical protein DDQ68_02315 [Hymenobacter nivis]
MLYIVKPRPVEAAVAFATAGYAVRALFHKELAVAEAAVGASLVMVGFVGSDGRHAQRAAIGRAHEAVEPATSTNAPGAPGGQVVK